MSRFFMALRNTLFFRIFNLRDDHAKGRSVMLASAVLSSSISYLTGGVFYTSFLIANDMDIVNLGIISILPLIASSFSIFAPLILERFKKRRVVLAVARITYFAINILGITVMPYIIQGKSARVVAFGAIVFLSTLVNALFTGGYTIWHLNFIPNNVRADYFSLQQIIATAFSSTVLLTSSFVADALRGTPHQLTILIVLRVVAFALALVEMVILLLPKEYPYAKSVAKPKLKDVVRLPFSNKKFMYVMLLIGSWTFAAYFTASSLTYYLLNDVGVKYSFINTIDATYSLFLIFLSPFWRRILRRWSWLKTFAITALIHAPSMILYSFLYPGNYLWLMPLVRLSQHAIGVGLNLSYANLPFLNLPETDQTNYLVFYTLFVNLSGFAGLTLATWFISRTPNLSFSILGVPFGNVQVLIAAQGFCQLLIALLVFKFRKGMEPVAATQ